MKPQLDKPVVHVVDDDAAIRDSLLWLLESAGYRVVAFDSAEAFFSAYRPGCGACILLDVRMPGHSGIEVHAELKKRGDRTPVIFITGHGDVPMAVNAVKNGAFDFIEKPFRDDALLAQIDAAVAGALAQSRDECERAASASRLAALTKREREVMDRVVAGLRNKQIADELAISIKTVEVHRARVMEKLGVDTVAELVQVALKAANPDTD